MKKIQYYVICLVMLLISCTNRQVSSTLLIDTRKAVKTQQQLIDKDSAYLELNTSVYDFGVIKQHKVKNITLIFEIKNSGKTPLTLFNADVSCRCLSVEYSKKVMMHTDKNTFKVSINTSQEKGIFNKVIYLTSNASNDIVLLRIKGIIN